MRAVSVPLNPWWQDLSPSFTISSQSIATNHERAAVVHTPFRAGTEQELLGRSMQQPTPKSGDQREVTRLRVLASAFLWPYTTAGAFTTWEVHNHHSLTFAVTSGTPFYCHSSGTKSWDSYFILFVLSCTIAAIALSYGIALLLRDHCCPQCVDGVQSGCGRGLWEQMIFSFKVFTQHSGWVFFLAQPQVPCGIW